MEDDATPVSTWMPLTDPVDLAHIGKLAEECAELSKICARIIIQGLDGVDPETGVPNMEALGKEIADVTAMQGLCIERYQFDIGLITSRALRKQQHKRAWHKALAEGRLVHDPEQKP